MGPWEGVEGGSDPCQHCTALEKGLQHRGFWCWGGRGPRTESPADEVPHTRPVKSRLDLAHRHGTPVTDNGNGK